MQACRIEKPYPTDVSGEEWTFVSPHLALVRQDTPQRRHDLREVLRRAPEPTAAVERGRTLRSTLVSGSRAG